MKFVDRLCTELIHGSARNKHQTPKPQIASARCTESELAEIPVVSRDLPGK